MSIPSARLRIIETPRKTRTAPPATPTTVVTVGMFRRFAKPRMSMAMRGNSTSPWPTAIHIPASRSSYPFATAAANTGPGIITPLRDMKAVKPSAYSRL